METQDTINARAARLQQGLEAAFGVRAKTLDKALRRTGRRLPRRLHKAARQVVDAQTLGGHPRQLRQVDGTALDTAVTRVLDYLQNIDRAGARRGRILNLAALIAFQILVILVVFVIWLVWRGYV